MSSIANITVKATNGTTDVIYVAKTPSAGDSLPAKWSADAVGPNFASHPKLEIKFSNNGPGTARRGTLTFSYPEVATDTTTGLVSIVNKGLGELSLLLPNGMPDAQANEVIDQMFNLINHALVRTQFKERYAAT
jgi:hypothetical protein